MSKKIGITIISDIEDLLNKVNDFADNFSGGDTVELPHILNALKEWELKNISFLTIEERNCFKNLKSRIENLMNEFKILPV